MKLARRYSTDSKAISTNPSNASITPVHNYHMYDSLLHYMSSYICDLELNVIDLKETVYSLLEIDVPESKFNKNQSEEQCQVQFMMGKCRKVRQDIVRVAALMKGYCNGKVCVDGMTKLFNEIENVKVEQQKINIEQLSNYQLLNQNNSVNEYKKFGFLTFREFNQDGAFSFINNHSCSPIQQENIQHTRNQQQSFNDIKKSAQFAPIKMTMSEQIKRAIHLVNLIKQQTNKIKHKHKDYQTQQKKSISNI